MFNKKLGFYRVGNIDFDSKIKALIYSKQVNIPMQWVFNDYEYFDYDWKIEPIETLDELYDKRSRELREKYDYIMLSYSGGADSHNILMSFIRQNLHIDEIIVNTMKKGDSEFTTIDSNNKDPINAAAEFDLQTMPRLKEASVLIPNTKITICDLTDFLFNYLEKAGDASWILDKREGLNPLGMTRFNYLHLSEVRKQLDKDISVGVVLGLDKPRTIINNGNFYMRINDRTTNIATISEHFREYDNTNIEFFYWSPDALDIQCKQVHVIKRWLEAFPQYQSYWDTDKTTVEKFNSNIRLVHERILRTVLYTTWDNSWYQADKATSDWYSEFDSWFIEGYKDSKAGRIWHEGIKYIQSELEGFTRVRDDGVVDGLMLMSRSHYIGKMKPNLG